MSREVFSLKISRATLCWLGACGVIALLFYIVGQLGATARTTRAVSANAIEACVLQHLSDLRKQNAVVSPEGHTAAFDFCKSLTYSKLLADEQIIRNETMVLQRDQNAAMLSLVVAITIGGVMLAGLQLVASFYIGKEGRSAASSAGDFKIKSTEFSLKSSYVGVVILGLSLAFFVVFVLFVYRIDEVTSGTANSDARTNTGVLSNR